MGFINRITFLVFKQKINYMANQVVTTSKQFTLNLSDWWKGLIMAVVAPVIAIIMNSINAGSLTFNWHLIWVAAVSGALAYLAKNFFDSPKIVVTGASTATIDAVKSGDASVKVGDVTIKPAA